METCDTREYLQYEKMTAKGQLSISLVEKYILISIRSHYIIMSKQTFSIVTSQWITSCKWHAGVL